MQPPRLADTAERDYFTLEEAESLLKNNWKEPRNYINEQCLGELPISMGNSLPDVMSNTRASSGV